MFLDNTEMPDYQQKSQFLPKYTPNTLLCLFLLQDEGILGFYKMNKQNKKR